MSSSLVRSLAFIALLSLVSGFAAAGDQDPIPGCNGWTSENTVYLSINQTVENCLAPRLSFQTVLFPLKVSFRNVTFDSSTFTLSDPWTTPPSPAFLQMDIINSTSYFSQNLLGAGLVYISAITLLPGSYIRIADSKIAIQNFGVFVSLSATSKLWGSMVEVSNNTIAAYPSTVVVVGISGGSELGSGTTVAVFNNSLSLEGQSYDDSEVSFTIISAFESTKAINMTNGFRAAIYDNVVSLGGADSCQLCPTVSNVYQTTTTLIFFKSSTTSFTTATNGGGGDIYAELAIYNNTATWDSYVTTKALSMILFYAVSTTTCRVKIEGNTLTLLAPHIVGQIKIHNIMAMSIKEGAGIADVVIIRNNLLSVRTSLTYIDTSGTITLLYADTATFSSEVLIEGNSIDLLETLTYYEGTTPKHVSILWVAKKLICASGTTLNITNNVLNAVVDYWSTTTSDTSASVVYVVVGALVKALFLDVGVVYTSVGNTIIANQSYLGTRNPSGLPVDNPFTIYPNVAAPSLIIFAFRISDNLTLAPSSMLIFEGNTLHILQPTTGMNDANIRFISITVTKEVQLQASSAIIIRSNIATIEGVPEAVFMLITGRGAGDVNREITLNPGAHLDLFNNTMSINITTPLKNASATPSTFSFMKLDGVGINQIQQGSSSISSYLHLTSNAINVVMLYPTSMSVALLHLTSQLNVTIHTDDFFLLDKNSLSLTSSDTNEEESDGKLNADYLQYLANISALSSSEGNIAILRADNGVVFDMASTGGATITRCVISIPYYVDLALFTLHIHILDLQPTTTISTTTTTNTTTTTSSIGGVIITGSLIGGVVLDGNTMDIRLVTTAEGPCGFIKSNGERLSGPSHIAISLLALTPANINLDNGGRLGVYNNNVFVTMSTGSVDGGLVSVSSSCTSIDTTASVTLLSVDVEVMNENTLINITSNALTTSYYYGTTSTSITPSRVFSTQLLSVIWNSTTTTSSWFGTSISSSLQSGINMMRNVFTTTSANTTTIPSNTTVATGIISLVIYMAVPPSGMVGTISNNPPFVRLHDNTLISPSSAVLLPQLPSSSGGGGSSSFIRINITTTNADALAPRLLLTTGSFIDLSGNHFVVQPTESSRGMYVPDVVGVYIGVDSPTAIIDSVLTSKGNVFTMGYLTDDPPSTFLHENQMDPTIKSKFITFKLESTTQMMSSSSSSVVNSWGVCGGNYIEVKNEVTSTRGTRSIRTLADGVFTTTSNINNITKSNCYTATATIADTPTSTPTASLLPQQFNTPTVQVSHTQSLVPPPPTTSTTTTANTTTTTSTTTTTTSANTTTTTTTPFTTPTTTTTTATTTPSTTSPNTTTTTPSSTTPTTTTPPPLASCSALLTSPFTSTTPSTTTACTSQSIISMHALWVSSDGLATIPPNITTHPPNLANPSNINTYKTSVSNAKTAEESCSALAGGVVETVPWGHWGDAVEPVWVGLSGPYSTLLGYYSNSGQSTYLSIPNATSLSTLNTAIQFTAHRVVDDSSDASTTATATSNFHVQLERMMSDEALIDTTTTNNISASSSSSSNLKLSISYIGPSNPVAGYKLRILLPASHLLRCEDGSSSSLGSSSSTTMILLEVVMSPKPQLTDTAAIGNGVGAVGAVGGGISGSSGSVVKAGLLTSLASLLRCEAPDLAAPVPLLQNTLSISFGPSEEGQYYRGGIVSGIIIFVIVGMVLVLALIPAKMFAIMGEYTAAVSSKRQQQGRRRSSTVAAVFNASFTSSFGGLGPDNNRNRNNASFSSSTTSTSQLPQSQQQQQSEQELPPPPPTWLEAIKFAHFPGVLILVVTLCGEAIVPSASTLISMPGATGGDVTFGVFGLLLYVVYIGHVLYTVGVNPPVVVRTKAAIPTPKRGSKVWALVVKLFSSPVVLVPSGLVSTTKSAEDGSGGGGVVVEDSSSINKYARPTPETVSTLYSLSGIRSLLASPTTSTTAAWLLLYTPYSDELQMISFKAIELAGGTLVNLLDGIVTDHCFIKGIGLLLVALVLFTIIVIKRPYAVPSQQVMSMALYGSLLLATTVVVVNLFKHHSMLDDVAEILFIITAALTVLQAAVDVMVSLVTVNVFVTSLLGWRRAAVAAASMSSKRDDQDDSSTSPPMTPPYTPPTLQRSPTNNPTKSNNNNGSASAAPPLLVLEEDDDDDVLYCKDVDLGRGVRDGEAEDYDEEEPLSEREIQRRILLDVENWACDEEMEESLI